MITYNHKSADNYVLKDVDGTITCNCAEWLYWEQCRHVDKTVIVDSTDDGGVVVRKVE